MPAAVPPVGGIGAKLAKQLFDWADRVETKLNTASENGVFDHQERVRYKDVLDPVLRAIAILAPVVSAPDPNAAPSLSVIEYNEARDAVDTAGNLLDRAYNSVPLGMKLVYVYGFWTWLYLLLVLIGVVIIAIYFASDVTGPFVFLSIPIQAILFGALGGILRGGWALWYRVNRREYRKVWGVWFLLAPIMGGLLGAAIYLAFFVGLVATTQTVDFTNPQATYLVAFLAGFNWQWAADILEKVAKDLGGKSDTEAKSE